MKFPQPIPVRELALQINADIYGNDSQLVFGINEIHQVEPGDLTFCDLEKYFKKALESAASVILLHEKTEPPPGKTVLVVKEPFAVFDGLVRRFRPVEPLRSPISHAAEIHPTTILEPGVMIGNQVKIGKNCLIQANSVIYEHTIIGDDVTVGPNCSIGTEAFYFKKTAADGFQKWRSGGRVILKNRVDIGPGCTIAKGVSGDTIVGEGTKLDGQIHLGHEVQIGKNCLFAAQVGVGGNTKIGDNVVIYGQVGIAQNLEIGDGAVILAKSGVSKNLPGGKTYFGYPADDTRLKYRELAALRQLPDFLKKK